MDKLTKLDANACDVFRKEFDAAMKQIEEKLGIKVCLGRLTYDPDSVSGKLVFGIDNNINLRKLTEKEWVGLKFRWDSTTYQVIEKDFDDTVIALNQRGKRYRVRLLDLEEMVLLNVPNESNS